MPLMTTFSNRETWARFWEQLPASRDVAGLAEEADSEGLFVYN